MNFIIYFQFGKTNVLPTVNVLLHCYSHLTGAITRKIDKSTIIKNENKASFKKFMLGWFRRFKACETHLQLNTLLQILYKKTFTCFGL